MKVGKNAYTTLTALVHGRKYPPFCLFPENRLQIKSHWSFRESDNALRDDKLCRSIQGGSFANAVQRAFELRVNENDQGVHLPLTQRDH